jgi:hypothetical protein
VAYSSTLNVEVVQSFETSEDFYQTTRHHIPEGNTFCSVETSNLTINFLAFRSDYKGSADKVCASSHRGHGRIYRQWLLWHWHDHWYRFCSPSYHRGDRRNCLYCILTSTYVHYGGYGQALWVSSSVGANWNRWIVGTMLPKSVYHCTYQSNVWICKEWHLSHQVRRLLLQLCLFEILKLAGFAYEHGHLNLLLWSVGRQEERNSLT